MFVENLWMEKSKEKCDDIFGCSRKIENLTKKYFNILCHSEIYFSFDFLFQFLSICLVCEKLMDGKKKK